MSSRKNAERAVIVFTAIAALLRLYGLSTESLWLDEGTTVWRIARGYASMFFDWDDATQGPLYYVALKAWCGLVGTTEFALRLPSAILGVITVPLVYRLGRRLFGTATGVLAALLLAINPFAIHYSQEARPYALFLLLSVVSVGYLLRLCERYARRDAAAYVIASTAAFYTHAFAPFLLLTHGAIVLAARSRGPRDAAALSGRQLAGIAASIVFLCVPQSVAYAKELFDVAAGTSSASVIPEPTLRFLGKVFVNYFMSPRLAAAALLVIAFGFARAFAAGERAREAALILLAAGACCAFLPWAVSKLFAPILTARYTIPALAAALILAAAGIAQLRGAFRAGALAIVLVLTGAALADYYTLVDKDPWRQTAEYLESESRAGDVIVVFPRWSYRPLGYYLAAPPDVRVAVPRSEEDLAGLAAAAERVWLVESYPGPAVLRGAIGALLGASYAESSAVMIDERLACNPHAYKLKPIRVACYIPRARTVSSP